MRPADLRISECAMWPRMTAAMEAGRKIVKIPQIRLAMALPLVGGLPSSGGGVANEPTPTAPGPVVGRTAAAAGSGLPHLEQNWPESGLGVPQFLKNMTRLKLCLRGNIALCLTNARHLCSRLKGRVSEPPLRKSLSWMDGVQVW